MYILWGIQHVPIESVVNIGDSQFSARDNFLTGLQGLNTELCLFILISYRVSQHLCSEQDWNNCLPMSGRTVVLNAPEPTERRAIATAMPGRPAPARSAPGNDVPNSIDAPIASILLED